MTRSKLCGYNSSGHANLFSHLLTFRLGVMFVLVTLSFTYAISDPIITGWTPESYVAEQGFGIRNYTIQTEDNYLLSLWRFNSLSAALPDSILSQRPPILICHGILDTGLIGAYNTQENSLAYLLWNAGFDVWAINFRGTTYSRSHRKISVDSDEYWAFSYDQQAWYDIPAALKKISAHTKFGLISLLGHSMGSTSIMALLTDAKVRGIDISGIGAVMLMSPVVFASHMTTLVIDKLVSLPDGFTEKTIYRLLGTRGALLHEPLANFAPNFCHYNPSECAKIINAVGGGAEETDTIDSNKIYLYVNFYPSGCSTRSLGHFVQAWESGEFRMFDYGTARKNRDVYGTSEPPIHDFKNIPRDLPILLMSGGEDELADPTDFSILVNQLTDLGFPNLSVLYLEDYAHADFNFGEDLGGKVYKRIMEFQCSHVARGALTQCQ